MPAIDVRLSNGGLSICGYMRPAIRAGLQALNRGCATGAVRSCLSDLRRMAGAMWASGSLCPNTR